MTPSEKIQLGYYLGTALGLFFGMIIMAAYYKDKESDNP